MSQLSAIRLLLLFLAFACLASAAKARDDQNATVIVEETSPIASDSDAPETAFVTTIELDDFQDQQRSVAEILRGTPGVDIRDFGGLGKLTTVSVRGSTAEQVCVFIDGVRLNPGQGSGVDLSTINPDTISRIEVVRGAASAELGDGCVGGALLLYSKIPVPDQQETSASASLTYGSFSTTEVASSFDTSGNFGAITLQGARFQTDGDYPFTEPLFFTSGSLETGRRVRKNNDQESISSLLRYRPALKASDLIFSLHGFWREQGIPGPINAPTPEAVQEDWWATFITNFATDIKQWNLDMDFAWRETGFEYTEPSSLEGTPAASTDQQTRFLSSSMSLSRNISAVFKLSGEVGSSWERLNQEGFQPERRTAFAAAFLDGSFLANRFKTSLSGRYEDVSEFGSFFVGGIGTTYAIRSNLLLQGNVRQGYRIPSFVELFQQAGTTVGNPALKEESSVSSDIGMVWLPEKSRVEVVWFYQDYDDLIQYLFISGFRNKPFNLSSVMSRGVEVSASSTPTSWFSMSGSFTWNEVIELTNQNRAQGQQVPSRPLDKGRLNITFNWDWDSSRISPFFEYVYIGESAIDSANTTVIEKRHILNSGISVTFNNYLILTGEVKNILDETYYDLEFYPLPPRTFFVTATIDLGGKNS